MSDIAQLAGVSPSAVSFALNGRAGVSDGTRARILAIAEEVGWFPSAAARALTGARTGVVGLVLTRSPRVISVHPFHSSFIAGLDARLSEFNYSLLLHLAASEADAVVRQRRWHSEQRVDGVVAMDLQVNDRRLDELQRIGLPTVVVGDPHYAKGYPAVWADDSAAISTTVARLVQLGHQRLARVSESQSMAYSAVRNQAFLDACAIERTSAPQIRYIAETGDAGDVTRDLLSQPRDMAPTAIIYDSDLAAVSGLRTAREVGIVVPADLSIVAYDDSLLCEVSDPPLSAISHDVYELGSHVASALIALIEGEGMPADERDATPRLVERGSTGPAPL